MIALSFSCLHFYLCSFQMQVLHTNFQASCYIFSLGIHSCYFLYIKRKLKISNWLFRSSVHCAIIIQSSVEVICTLFIFSKNSTSKGVYFLWVIIYTNKNGTLFVVFILRCLFSTLPWKVNAWSPQSSNCLMLIRTKGKQSWFQPPKSMVKHLQVPWRGQVTPYNSR